MWLMLNLGADTAGAWMLGAMRKRSATGVTTQQSDDRRAVFHRLDHQGPHHLKPERDSTRRRLEGVEERDGGELNGGERVLARVTSSPGRAKLNKATKELQAY
ncbi:hypothetical protein FOPE_09170 [Fonsecaea pedrosoi]|nr:hypothetical protein FOPE_09170 [Fonsecaea pedrosoi]